MVHLTNLTALAFAIIGVSARTDNTANTNSKPTIHFHLQRYANNICSPNMRVGRDEHLKDWGKCKKFSDKEPEGPYSGFTIHTNEVEALDGYECTVTAFKDHGCNAQELVIQDIKEHLETCIGLDAPANSVKFQCKKREAAPAAASTSTVSVVVAGSSVESETPSVIHHDYTLPPPQTSTVIVSEVASSETPIVSIIHHDYTLPPASKTTVTHIQKIIMSTKTPSSSSTMKTVTVTPVKTHRCHEWCNDMDDYDY